MSSPKISYFIHGQMRFFSNLSVFLTLALNYVLWKSHEQFFFSHPHLNTTVTSKLTQKPRSTPTTLLCNVCQHGISDPCEAFESSVHMVKKFLLFSIGSKPIDQKLKREKLDIPNQEHLAAKIDCLFSYISSWPNTKYDLPIFLRVAIW